MKTKKVRRRKDHMNIIVCNEDDKFEIVHVPDSMASEYISTFDLTCVPTKEEVFEFLLHHNLLRVK